MLVVLDTNVLVSALLSPFGPPARVLNMILRGEIQAAFDDRVLIEYREVLLRPKFGFAPEDVETVLTYLETDGVRVVPRPLPYDLPDPDDLPFLEVAAEVGALLITGTTAHYPAAQRGAVRVTTPGEFMKEWSQAPRETRT